jgi:two-component system sensor histidine kinase VicK
MFRSLHMKLVLIMVLLIISLMTVVGAFLINSVVGFYLDDFYNQMIQAFNNDTEFVRLLTVQTSADEDGILMLRKVLSDNMGALGVDGRSRNY